MPRQRLSVYRVRDEIDGTPVTDFKDVIRPDVLTDPRLIRGTAAGSDFEAEAFLFASGEREPPWLAFVRGGFPGVAPLTTESLAAVLVLRFSYYNKKRYLAFTFGHGRHLLRAGAYIRDAGLRMALNVIYGSGAGTAEFESDRIRQIDARTVGQNTLHTRRQTNRRATFETFGVDILHDMLRGVTGRPIREDAWGPRVSGADAFQFGIPIEFNDLGQLGRHLFDLTPQI